MFLLLPRRRARRSRRRQRRRRTPAGLEQGRLPDRPSLTTVPLRVHRIAIDDVDDTALLTTPPAPYFPFRSPCRLHASSLSPSPMTSRPTLASKRRPSSAIFLGSLPPPNLPDLPEPPSPGAASNSSASGLPSPPATNSTGSGSTGDNSQDGGSIRRRSASDANMVNGASSSNSGPKRPASPDGQDGDDEDNTARLSKRRSLQSSTSNENADALKRVMSLTQRNRAVSLQLILTYCWDRCFLLKTRAIQLSSTSYASLYSDAQPMAGAFVRTVCDQ